MVSGRREQCEKTRGARKRVWLREERRSRVQWSLIAAIGLMVVVGGAGPTLSINAATSAPIASLLAHGQELLARAEPNDPIGNNSTSSAGGASPMITCSPPPGDTCVTLVLPQSGATYLASITFAGTTYTTDQTIYAVTGNNVISATNVASGYSFSFWGNSSGLSVSGFEGYSTPVDVVSPSYLYLNVYSTGSASTVTFLTHPEASGTDFGWINASYHEFTSGQSADFTQRASLAVNATAGASYYRFQDWTISGGAISGSTDL